MSFCPLACSEANIRKVHALVHTCQPGRCFLKIDTIGKKLGSNQILGLLGSF
jgi:hypothetical protein